ncbi:MAG: type II toxin-antitoxin system YoeB family toxin [Candidatus Margulisbacteria bacterium]|nr:type II toxin-antitoxin system YoeB family toxin [Candidatus Margulisiibacteriota bacterium]
MGKLGGGCEEVLIEYDNKTVLEYFNDFELMKKEIGSNIARAAKKRVNQLIASPNFSVYLTTGLGKPHPLYEDLKGYYGITITGNVRLIVQPYTDSLEAAALKNCDTVIIKGVMNYHGRKNEWLIP